MTAKVINLSSLQRDMVPRVGTGDQDSFRRLYKQYAPYAYAVVRRMMGNSPHVDDVLQQVFVKVYLDLPEFQGDRPFRSWLSRACCHTVYSHMRKERRHDALSLEDNDSAPAMATADGGDGNRDRGPERDYFEAEIHRRTHAVLSTLAPVKRMALMMCDFEGYTVEEAADILGTAKFTLRTRLVRARKEFARRAAKDKQLVQLIESGERS